MTIFQAVLMGIIEGLTEFLPVSSTGHMIIACPWLGIDGASDEWHAFLYVSQFGAILAVVLYFWRDLWRQTAKLGRVPWPDFMPFKLCVAVVPAIVLGMMFNKYMEQHLENNPKAVAGALIVGAGLMVLVDWKFRTKARMSVEQVTLRQAGFVGLIQCVSMWPGTSRSMATIMGGMVAGLPAKVATEFSFYLAIPTMVLAAGYKLIVHHDKLSSGSAAVLLIGSSTAFLVALLVVHVFLKFVQTQKFTVFAVYRVLLGALVLWLVK